MKVPPTGSFQPAMNDLVRLLVKLIDERGQLSDHDKFNRPAGEFDIPIEGAAKALAALAKASAETGMW